MCSNELGLIADPGATILTILTRGSEAIALTSAKSCRMTELLVRMQMGQAWPPPQVVSP